MTTLKANGSAPGRSLVRERVHLPYQFFLPRCVYMRLIPEALVPLSTHLLSLLFLWLLPMTTEIHLPALVSRKKPVDPNVSVRQYKILARQKKTAIPGGCGLR